MTQKLPPPPPLAVKDQALNRWLLELTSILNNQGVINQGSVDGLPAVATQVNTNTTGITGLNTQVAALNGQVASLNVQVVTLQGQVTTLQGQVTALQANPVPLNGVGVPAAGLGKVGDWYGNLTGAVGARVYIKTGVATWTPFPF